MVCQPVLGDLRPPGPGLAVIAVGIDGDAAPGQELAPHLNVLGVQQADQVLHDDIDAVLVEIPVIAEGEEIELQALTLHQLLVRYIGDVDGGEVRLAGNGTQAGKLRAVELDEVIVVRVLVAERFQHGGVVVRAVAGVLAAQQGQIFFFSCHGNVSFHHLRMAGSATPLAAKAAARSMQVPHLPQGSSPPS